MANFKDLQAADPGKLPATELARVFYQGTIALGKYAHEIIRPLLDATLSLSDREKAIVGTFRRMAVWVDSLVRVGYEPIQFQAAAAACRGMFELVMDLKILDADQTNKSSDQFHAYTEVDRYWVADKFVEYKTNHPNAKQFSIGPYKERLDKPGEKARIEGLIVTNWGKTAKGKIVFPDHWTNKTAWERADSLGEVTGEQYRFLYPITSWCIHAGFAGQGGLPVSTYSLYVAQFNAFAQDFFTEGLKITAKTLKFDIAIKDIGQSLRDLGLVSGMALMTALVDKIDADAASAVQPAQVAAAPAPAAPRPAPVPPKPPKKP